MCKMLVKIVFVLFLFIGIVEANQSPIITYNGASDVQILLGEAYKDLGATAKDKEDGDLTGSIQTSSNVNTSLAGSYKVTYSVTDSSGRTEVLSRNVNVVEKKTDYQVSWENKFNLPPQDKDGWSILTPSEDSRIVYVSSSEGDDNTAEIYDITKVSNVYNPSNIKAYQTIDAAYKQIREGYPDYMLLKRGDIWLHKTIKVKGGVSSEKRLVIGAYGDESLDRPLIKTGVSGGLNFYKANGNYSAVVGIKFEANGRDPNSEDFVGFSNVGRSKGFEAINWNGQFKGSILVEDCWFDWYYSNTILNKNVDKSGKDISSLSDIIIRRNIISNSYAHQGHSDGLVLMQTSVLLEENLFDHNGWYQKPNAEIRQKYINTDDEKYINDVEGQATFHNTSVKFYAPKNSIFRKNMFLRTSSTANEFSSNIPSSLNSNEILSWNILVDNNFYVEGETAIRFGGHKDKNDGARWKNILVTNNVLTGIGRTQPVNRVVGYGLSLSDWQNGLVQNNILTKWGKKDVYLNTEGIKSTGHVTNTVFEKNILNDIVSNKAVVILSDMDNKKRVEGAINNIFFVNNEINLSKDNSGRVIDYGIIPEKQTFADNYFYSEKDKSEWFRTTTLRTMGFEEFKTLTKDTTTLPQQRKYFDDSRTISSYLKSLGYGSDLDESTEVDALAKLVTKRKKGNWNKNLTTDRINEYFKEGFEVIKDDEPTNDNYQVSWENKFNLPPQDKDGWSILTPSEDSRIVYVSSSEGDDNTAEIYDITKVSNVYNPSNIKAYQTIDAAYKQIREGYPDYMLLKRGDVWTRSRGIVLKSGESVDKRAVIAAYSSLSLDRPIVRTGVSGGLRAWNVNNTALVSIKFEANGRNPNSKDFVGFEDVGNSKGYELKNVAKHNLIEDCWFDWYLIGISIQDNNTKESEAGEKDTNLNDAIIRRNLITNSYGQIGHSQGIYSFITSSLLEENILDHNGWYQHPNSEIRKRYKGNKKYYEVGFDGKVKVNHLGDAEGQATIFNHGSYFAESRDTIFRKNIFLRSSSIGSKFTSNTHVNENVPNKIKAWNILVDNNFYAGGEIGISLGGNKDQNTGPRWQNILVTNNVLTSIGINHPTKRDVGWGIGVNDWKKGLVKGNVITTWGDGTSLKNNKAITSTGHMMDTLFDSNIIYNIIGTQYAVVFSDYDSKQRIDGAQNNIAFTNNEINLPKAYDTRIVAYGMKPTIQNFSNNYFYSSSRKSRWFTGSGSKYIPIEDYRDLSGDTTSLALQREYVEPNRTINSFLESFGYATNLDNDIKIEILSNLLKKQRKGNWDKNLDASNINNYFRAGFCISGNEACR